MIDQIDTRPQRIGIATAYRLNDLPLEVITDINLSQEVIFVSHWDGEILLQENVPFTIEGGNLFIDFTSQQILDFPLISQCKTLINGDYKYLWEIRVLEGYATPVNTTGHIKLDLRGTVTPALEALASQVAGDRTQTGLDRVATGQDRTAVHTDKLFVEAVANADTTVDTYTQAAALFTGNIKRDIFVNQSSQYNEAGEFFTWFPAVQKAAHMGLNFTYLTDI